MQIATRVTTNRQGNSRRLPRFNRKYELKEGPK